MVNDPRAGRRQNSRRPPSSRTRMNSVLLVLALASSWLTAVAKAADQTETATKKHPTVSCSNDQECVDHEGYGYVCVEALCRSYEDRTDLFEVAGLKQKTQAPPEP